MENLENNNKTLKDQLKEHEEIRLAEAEDFKTKNEDLINQVAALVKENNTLEEAAQQLHGQIRNLEINVSKQEEMIEDVKRIKMKHKQDLSAEVADVKIQKVELIVQMEKMEKE